MTDKNFMGQYLPSPKYNFFSDSPTVPLLGKGKKLNFQHLVNRLLLPPIRIYLGNINSISIRAVLSAFTLIHYQNMIFSIIFCCARYRLNITKYNVNIYKYSFCPHHLSTFEETIPFPLFLQQSFVSIIILQEGLKKRQLSTFCG